MTAPEDRGGLTISPQVVRKVAEHAIGVGPKRVTVGGDATGRCSAPACAAFTAAAASSTSPSQSAALRIDGTRCARSFGSGSRAHSAATTSGDL